ncbi:hypothetical protein LUS60_06735 [Raoultella planticola]|nr:hypothetical protein [Raoultella planticola]MCD9604988.1 hypothetical protein [Raoultella planticola]
MTDINELSQREKFEAWFVNDVVGADVNFPAFKDGEYAEGEIYDEQLYFMLQAMWMAWKAANDELVEALEKAQQRIAELEEAEQKLCAANVTLDARAELAERQRIAELEPRIVSVKLLTPEVRNALKAEGLADVLKDAAEYAPLTAGQWETLTKNWYQTFIGLSGSAAGIKWETE